MDILHILKCSEACIMCGWINDALHFILQVGVVCLLLHWPVAVNLCHNTELATEVFGHLSSLNSTSDPDNVLLELDHALLMIDSVPRLNEGCYQLAAIHRHLVNLYEHWMFIHSNLPPCTVGAVGVEGGRESHVRSRRQRGRTPIFLNLDMVEHLRGVGYTWSEVARALLVSRTMVWRKLCEANITLEMYSDISGEVLDNQVSELQLRHPYCGQVLLRSMLEAQGTRAQTSLKGECGEG